MPRSLVRWPRPGAPTVERIEDAEGLPRPTDYFTDGLLLVGPSHGEDLAERLGDRLAGTIDAEVIDDRRVAVLHRDGSLAWGEPPAEGSDWSHRVDLSSLRGRAPSWLPEIGRFSRGKGAGFPDATVIANERGVGIASYDTGNVALVRPDSEEVKLVLRIGVAWEDRIIARPTRAGLLVTIVYNGRATSVMHTGEDGRLLAHGAGSDEGGPPALALGRYAMHVQSGRAVLLDPRLSPVTQLPLAFRPTVSAASRDGRFFAFADDASVMLGEVEGGRLRELDRLEHAELRRMSKRHREIEAARRAYDPRRVPGDPAIGFAAKPTVTPPWRVEPGSFVQELVVRSAGGPGRGLWLRASGDALAHLQLSRIEVGTFEAPFVPDGDGVRAALPEVELVEGLALPLDPTPKGEIQKNIAARLLEGSHLTLRLHGEAAAASQDLLRIEIGPRHGASAPLKWMRPFVVT